MYLPPEKAFWFFDETESEYKSRRKREILGKKRRDRWEREIVKECKEMTKKEDQCGYREKKPLSQRTHSCNNCGYTTHRDTNAAQNILALGLDGLGKTPRSLRL